MLQQEEEVMSSQLNIINPNITLAEHFLLEMGKRLQAAAGIDLKNKLRSGEVKFINGHYVGESLKVQRPAKLSARAKKAQF